MTSAIASADLVDLQIQDGVLNSVRASPSRPHDAAVTGKPGGSEGPGLQVPPPQPKQQQGTMPVNAERGEKKDLLDRVDEAVACKCCTVS